MADMYLLFRFCGSPEKVHANSVKAVFQLRIRVLRQTSPEIDEDHTGNPTKRMFQAPPVWFFVCTRRRDAKVAGGHRRERNGCRE